MDSTNASPNTTQVALITMETLEEFGKSVAQAVIDSFLAKKEETYLTTKQAAKKLNVDPSTLYRWEKDNYLRPVRLGSKRRYRLSDIEKLMDNR